MNSNTKGSSEGIGRILGGKKFQINKSSYLANGCNSPRPKLVENHYTRGRNITRRLVMKLSHRFCLPFRWHCWDTHMPSGRI